MRIVRKKVKMLKSGVKKESFSRLSKTKLCIHLYNKPISSIIDILNEEKENLDIFFNNKVKVLINCKFRYDIRDIAPNIYYSISISNTNQLRSVIEDLISTLSLNYDESIVCFSFNFHTSYYKEIDFEDNQVYLTNQNNISISQFYNKLSINNKWLKLDLLIPTDVPLKTVSLNSLNKEVYTKSGYFIELLMLDSYFRVKINAFMIGEKDICKLSIYNGRIYNDLDFSKITNKKQRQNLEIFKPLFSELIKIKIQDPIQKKSNK